MIDNFSLGLTHGLMLLAAILLMRRPDLDDEGKSRLTGWLKRSDPHAAADDADA